MTCLGCNGTGEGASAAVREQSGGGQPSDLAALPDGERQPPGGLLARTRTDPDLHLAVQVLGGGRRRGKGERAV